jgi:hypothetical protein
VALPFWTSIGVLSTVQGGMVALPARSRLPDTLARGPAHRLMSRWWALIPALSVVAFVVGVRAAGGGTQVLTYVALVAVPVLAALALGLLTGGSHRLARALLVAPLFALAWADGGGLAGELAALALIALSCVSLGTLIAAVTPPLALGAGIVAMAVADASLVIAELLQRPNSALNAAHPAAGLPRLQAALFGSAAMGYGDLFVAGALGGLLAWHATRERQVAGAVLAVALALAFDALFLVAPELPATVPIALALLVSTAFTRMRPWRQARSWWRHPGIRGALRSGAWSSASPQDRGPCERQSRPPRASQRGTCA